MRSSSMFRSVCGSATLLLLAAASLTAQAPAHSPEVLDRVVAVVNNRAILASDIADELRFSVLDPEVVNGGTPLTPARALEQLISRTLIQQQIRQEDENASEPPPGEVQARIMEIRKELPPCTRQNCMSDAGWSAFMRSNGLTEKQIERYVRFRLEILRFIEIRFRQGIRISDEDIESYYREKLLPHYAKGASVPALKAVSPRIQEILLQEQVNALFSAWLENLRSQGDVEVLDPALESAAHVADSNGVVQ